MVDSASFFRFPNGTESDEEVAPQKRMCFSSNPLDIPNKRFIKLFRVTKDVFLMILKEIEPHFKNTDGIKPIIKLACTLGFLAEGSFQIAVEQDYLIGMTQTTAELVLSETLNVLESTLCDKYINFHLSEDDKCKSKNYFTNYMSFPGVIGCVDAIHIKIAKPAIDEGKFLNNNGTHSLNVMMTCDYKMEITSVDCRYGGYFHKSQVWHASYNRIYMEQNWAAGDKSSWLLGDSGYTLEPWLMTPYRTTIPGSPEALYNKVQAKARSIIDRVFWILKGRWRCLLDSRQLNFTPEKAAQIVKVCCLLHNICVRHNVPIDENVIKQDDGVDPTEDHEMLTNLADEARWTRDSMKNIL